MAFYQLHYTSRESSLSGYSGFQFCAATPGVPDFVMREVEQQTVYEPPAVMQETPGMPLAEFPVNLLHAYSRDSGTLIISCVRYAGLDFSNRAGNYFAHTLVSDSPARDLARALPVELWGAPFWDARPSDAPELPPLPPPSPSGAITPQTVDDFVRARSLSEEQLAALLTAVEGAMTGGRQVLLIDSGTDAVCRWIAVVAYLLGPVGGRQLTFSTYSLDPRRCQTHVVGTVSAAKPLRADIMTGLHVFDPAAGVTPVVAPSPAALLVARLGVGAAAETWHLAESLATEPGRTLAGALPTLASAALMLGHRLTAFELIQAISWIHAQPDRVSASRLVAAADGALSQSLGDVPTAQKDQLIDIARRIDDTGPGADGPRLRLTEQRLVAAALSEYDNGGTPGDGARLQTVAGRKAAADGCRTRLAGCDSADAIRLLVWAAAADAALEPDTVWRVGYDAILPSLLAGHELPGLAAAAAAWPALRLGMVHRLASLPWTDQETVLSRRAVAVLTHADFASHLALGEKWLIAMVRAGQLPSVVALSRVVALRWAGDDERLLGQLWPNRAWTPAEAIDIVRGLPAETLAGQAVRSRLSALLHDVPDLADYGPWTVLVGELLRLPPDVLPRSDTELAREFQRLMEVSRHAATESEPDELIDELLRYHATGNDVSKNLLERILPALLMQHTELHRALPRCDDRLFISFCEFAASELVRKNLSHRDIGNLIVAMQLMELKHRRYSTMLDMNVLRPVLSEWTRDEMAGPAREARLIASDFDRPNADRYAMFWHQRIRNSRFRLGRIWTDDRR